MPNDPAPPGVLQRLLRDRSGNVLAISAAMIIPLAGMVGGGLDISRLYIAKTRLQHACDAGALAGRKAMGGGTWAQNSFAPRTTATQFFDGNYKATDYGGNSLTRTYTENAGRVAGTASVRMPMTLMKIFGKPTEVLSVRCDAEMRLPNTDVMFVLDVTGSMASKAVSSDPETKIQGLRTAVKCFYETVARLDTDATCVGGAPSGGTGNQVQVRFGFMPYSGNVNVGKLLPTSYFPNSWDYQTRVRNGTGSDWSDWLRYGYFYRDAAGNCSVGNTSTLELRNPEQGRWLNGYGTICRYEYRYYGPRWKYEKGSVDVSLLKNGSTWRNSFRWPINDDGTDATVNWDGCIEERATVQANSYSPIPANARDLDIDSIPTSDVATQWKPALPAVSYVRAVAAQTNPDYNTANNGTPPVFSYNNFVHPNSSCPAQASKLKSWRDANEFDGYVDSLQPTGNTYHDIGMLWGARFMSPTGIFASENATTPAGGEIQRHMIFMTDGDAVSQACDYTAYGIAYFDKRTTTDVGTASQCANMNGGRPALNAQINARLEALCTAVKNMNITLWVISFGNGSNTDTEDRLERCASPGRSFTARDSATLQNTFRSIADQISQLRLIS